LIAEQAARKALTLLDASPAPAGSMPVVVGGGFGGVLFHEMTGHGLEADHIQKGASVYVGKLGEQVAQPLLTAYDDGRLPNEWGSDAIDDEGTPTQKTRVIEDGRLVAFLYDRLCAGREGVASTGNGRRESFRHLPIPRMTNTYIAPGDAEPEAMIAEVEKGFYAVSFAGGQVDPATGDFVFGVSEGYLIEGGKVTRPCRGATLVGNCLQALAAIDAVGNDFRMKTGMCGKGGQKVPVGTGQGHVRIAAMTVGGTAL
jgi:TldD protein